MAQRQQKNSRSTPARPPPLATVHLHAAGIDVGANTHDVAVPPRDDPQPGHGFGACTADLEALADGLAACGVTTVALEATGVSWIPLFELLETRGFDVLLADPPPVRQLKGRPQRDGHDGQWWPRLHTLGLLAGAFRPADQVCVRRSYRRQRAMRLPYAGQHLQPRQTALTQMHIKLQHVVSAITGVTGMAMIRAIRAGERHPVTLAPRRDDRCHQDQEAIAQALRGQWREEHLFALAQAVALYDVYHQKIAECARQLAAHVATFADQSHGQAPPSGPRPRRRTRHQPAFEVQGHLHRLTGVDLTAIEGSDDTTALIIVSAMGLDMGRWPTGQHVTAWLGGCPHPQVSGGQGRSRGTKPSANRVATAWRLAASCLHHRRRALGAFFRRMNARLGTPKAITATAHTRARFVSTMRKYGTAYVAHSMEEDEQRSRERVVAHFTRRAPELGYTLVQTPVDAPA